MTEEQTDDLDAIIAESTAEDVEEEQTDENALDAGEDTAEETSQEDSAPPAIDPTLEAEARKYGWRPKEEWRGDKSGWVPPERFLELPSTEVKRQRDEMKAMKDDFQKRLEGIERGSKAAMEAQRRQHEKEIDRLKQERRSAAESGDMETYDRLDKELTEAEKAAPQVEPEKGDYHESGMHREVYSYSQTDEGAWLRDPFLQQAGAEVIATKPGAGRLPPLEQAKVAEQELRKHYPERFPQKEPPKQHRQTVDPGGLAGGRKSLASKLPAEARAQGKEFIDMGLFKNLDEYAKDYFGETA